MMLRGKPFDRIVKFCLEEVERAMDQGGHSNQKHDLCPFRPELTVSGMDTQKSSRLLEKIENTQWSVARPAHQDGDASTVFTNSKPPQQGFGQK